MDFKKQWKVYLIHHSHTDIGYTERQDKIINYHCDFIKQAIDILNDIHENHREEYQGFVWQCENYWQVKNFYAHARKHICVTSKSMCTAVRSGSPATI